MSVTEFVVTIYVFIIPIVGLSGYFIFKIGRMILNQRAAERIYMVRLARARARANAATQ